MDTEMMADEFCADTGCHQDDLPGAMDNDADGENESEDSVQSTQLHDDDDDDDDDEIAVVSTWYLLSIFILFFLYGIYCDFIDA